MESTMALPFDIVLKLPSANKGTKEDPCRAGDVQFVLPNWAKPNAISWQYGLDSTTWEPCTDPRLGPRWHRYGFEGHTPSLTLPIGHNTQENPCRVTFDIMTMRGGRRYQFASELWYYTPSCPFHRTQEEEEELEKQRWIRLSREFDRGVYKQVQYFTGTVRFSRQLNSVTVLILYELYPEKLTRGMMYWMWKGTGDELSNAVRTAGHHYSDMVAWAKGEEGEKPDEKPEPEPVPEPVPDPSDDERPVLDPDELNKPSIQELLDGISELVGTARVALYGIQENIKKLKGE
jgi:hypothetical protein